MNAFGGLQPCYEEGVLLLDRRYRNAEVFLIKMTALGRSV